MAKSKLWHCIELSDENGNDFDRLKKEFGNLGLKC